MHNPRSKDTRPLLPGQRFPGLGLGRKVGEVMEQMALDSDVTDGLLNFPFYWHLAVACAWVCHRAGVSTRLTLSPALQTRLEGGVISTLSSKRMWPGSRSKCSRISKPTAFLLLLGPSHSDIFDGSRNSKVPTRRGLKSRTDLNDGARVNRCTQLDRVCGRGFTRTDGSRCTTNGLACFV